MSRKIQGRLQKNDEKNIDFSTKNRWKIDEQVDCSTLPSKNRENHCSGISIFAKNPFFGRIWGPLGDPKITPKGWSTLAVDPPGTNLGSFWAPDRFFLDIGFPFGCLWAPFGVPQGFILRKTVMNFQLFSWFRLVGRIGLLVVVLGCLARLVDSIFWFGRLIGLVGWFDCADWLIDGAFVRLSRHNALHWAFQFHQYS